MAGVNVDTGGKGGRRSVDSEINMIPMIDLLVCAIAFLLITAVWSHMSRINADAQVPGPPNPEKELNPQPPDKMLHVEMRAEDKFTLIWKQGPTVVNSVDVPRHPIEIHEGNITTIRYPDLATKVNEEWKANGSHRDASDKKIDQAVLHTDNKTVFKEIVAVIDAIYTPKRDFGGASKQIPAFNVTFAVN
jgi:biopolymer transport protein ExbD